ncbi:SRPBCC family protein [Mycobacteroides salmoniphilum]|uniref:Polyketide cyclase / dehydrase and lipid transport n=1 Tax=Mycobacteroides salmoniphilum TaxID=404941 RepID=A0A4R8SMQ1_9MYCO|nr:SRPBCC family protein [Mycobacteroides salmoniphilum]TDZ99797.1 Polyketide cyclase / dehydrase and lipid transport [Mycobacteroides salmoniphilum]
MRYRDCPTIEVSQRMSGTVAQAWALVTDIGLPTYCTGELINVQWLDGADKVAVGARFKGTDGGDGSQWDTVSVITEVEPESRCVWNVVSEGGTYAASWGFEVEPASDGVIVRQWGRLGPGPSGLTPAIEAMPDKEARIVSRRLQDWRVGMEANLQEIAERLSR